MNIPLEELNKRQACSIIGLYDTVTVYNNLMNYYDELGILTKNEYIDNKNDGIFRTIFEIQLEYFYEGEFEFKLRGYC